MAKFTGGRKLTQFLRTARSAKQRSRSVEVGFFSTAKYPDGTPVASVAAWNEFGTELHGNEHIPERPFFRQAIKGAEDAIVQTIADHVDPKTMIIDARTAGIVGEMVKGRIQTSIVKLRDPPNAPSTVEMKGSSNPLIDQGIMRNSVSYKVRD